MLARHSAVAANLNYVIYKHITDQFAVVKLYIYFAEELFISS